jgi:hypothetical protein
MCEASFQEGANIAPPLFSYSIFSQTKILFRVYFTHKIMSIKYKGVYKLHTPIYYVDSQHFGKRILLLKKAETQREKQLTQAGAN